MKMYLCSMTSNISRRMLPQSGRGVDLHAHKPQETWREVKKVDFKQGRSTFPCCKAPSLQISGDPLCFSKVVNCSSESANTNFMCLTKWINPILTRGARWARSEPGNLDSASEEGPFHLNPSRAWGQNLPGSKTTRSAQLLQWGPIEQELSGS